MPPLSAEEFLREYQALAASATGLSAHIRSKDVNSSIEQLFKNREPTEDELKGLRELWTDFAGDTDGLRYAAKRLASVSPETRDFLSPIPIGTLPTFDSNAASIRSPSGEPIVVVDSGMTATVHEIATYWVATVPFPDSPPELSISEATWNTFRQAVFQLTKLPTWLPHPIVVECAHRRIRIGGLLDNALHFILGHEYGHILLGHLDESRIRECRPSDQESLPPLMVYERSHSQELDADAKGIDLAVGFSKWNHRGWIVAGILGIELVFQILLLLESLEPERKVISSHPSASVRRDRFHHAWADQIDERLTTTLEDMNQFFSATARAGKKFLEDVSRGS